MGGLGDKVFGLLSFADMNDESAGDSKVLGFWVPTANEPNRKPTIKNEMAARIVNVYFRTLHFTDTEFSFVHPDNLNNSIVFYYKKSFICYRYVQPVTNCQLDSHNLKL